MTVGGQDSCPSCRGQGWKFFMLRRSVANAGGAAERALLRRARVACLRALGPDGLRRHDHGDGDPAENARLRWFG